MTAAMRRLLVGVLCVLCAVWVEARRSHRNGGGFASERFIFREQCALKEEPGLCKAIKQRYYFNIDSGRCEMFEFGGCGGNDNNFESKEECEETCVVSEDKDPCQLPEAPGPCRGLVSRFLFDPETQSCRHFFYGGCFGNANNFRTMDECRSRCQNTDKNAHTSAAPRLEQLEVQTRATERPAPDPEPHAVVTAETPVAGKTEALVQVHNNTKEHHPKEVDWSEECQLSVDAGTCDEAHRRYYFNSATRRCQSFIFSGCGGNNNNFVSRRLCFKKCVHRHKENRGMMIRIRRKNLDKYRHISV
ncbi:LOW QUALITY PROTEIN: tissue factor pathway inhibitor a [Boleophthalmus pectinirostris]|uniref:LOW QUALITY PROTEIN: tissue factor pathway inhibitor a n=1 Tax=Boleophthalmus pectinirostris TaxID=150288 RepID=UPI000A1C7283|nr:LOW QUALITY PROTEIN: tissue factor pathway inhibitor a [Boleophthalmus pectinirostris]